MTFPKTVIITNLHLPSDMRPNNMFVFPTARQQHHHTTSPHYHHRCQRRRLPSYLEPTAEIGPSTITSFGPLVSFSYYVLCFLFDITNCYFWFLLGFYLSTKWHQDDDRNHSEDHGSTPNHRRKQLLAGWERVQLQMAKEQQRHHPTKRNDETTGDEVLRQSLYSIRGRWYTRLSCIEDGVKTCEAFTTSSQSR